MVYAGRKLALKVADHHQCLVGTGTEGINDALHFATVEGIQSMQRLIEYQQFGVFHKRPGQQYQTLFAIANPQEQTVGQVRYTESFHPLQAYLPLLRFGAYIQSDGIVQPTCHDVDGRQVLRVGTVHLRTYIAYVFLNVPNALTSTTLLTKQTHIAGIALRIVGTDDAEQR